MLGVRQTGIIPKMSTNIQNIIIHSTGTGPDHVRLNRILALKNISWSYNQIDDKTFANFPGGQDGLPILQYNRCFFVGSLVSMVALEQIKSEPTIFPNGNCGMPLALAWWSNDFFQTNLRQADDKLLQKYCTLITRQIADGRDFLQGAQAGLADVHSYAPLRALKECGQNISILDNDPLLAPWYQRVRNIGIKGFQTISVDENNLLNNSSAGVVEFQECDSIADKETLNWKNQGNIFLWRTPLTAKFD